MERDSQMRAYATPSTSKSKIKFNNESVGFESMSVPHQHHGTFGLAAAIERDDYDDLIVKNGEYMSRVTVGQGDVLDSVTDMVAGLGSEMQRSAASAADLVDKLSSLDNLIDEEKRKWIVKV
jgi:hypothetical protein